MGRQIAGPQSAAGRERRWKGTRRCPLEFGRDERPLNVDILALWLTWAAGTAAALWLARRFVARFPWKTGILLALLPLVFTGRAFVAGELYGPADLYYLDDPWKRVAAESGIDRIHNPILSDLAFANLPWRAAVREALVNGRLPLWNRFVLGGTPLLATAQASVFHPSTWLGIFLPLPLSWTFSCAFTIFLALVCAYLFFSDFVRSRPAAFVGAVGWGFSTYALFWAGWAVGPSIAAFPLLLLGLRRLAREGGGRSVGITAVALLLSVHGGHPETFFHAVAAGAVYFLWESVARDARRRSRRALGGALAAGAIAFCLSAPVLFPLLQVLPRSAEYATRREALERDGSDQSVTAGEAVRRLRPAVLPFAHGIYGKSVVQDWRQDGSGMPLAYAGAVLFPLAILGLLRNRQPAPADSPRGRWLFLGFFLAGAAYGASAPILLDATSALPGFALALNYRLVFLAPLGLAGLAALGADRLHAGASARPAGVAALATVAVLGLLFLLARPVFRARVLPEDFVSRSFAVEIVPIAILAIAALALPRSASIVAAFAVALLAGQRFLEMRDTYPTLPARSLAPPLPSLAAIPGGGSAFRVVAPDGIFRPNAAALYGLEDVRGYESLVLARFAETYLLWSRPQHASFNVVDDLSRPFLSFLNARYALTSPDTPAPPGWVVVTRTKDAAVLENRAALDRAFVPRRVRIQPDPRRRLAEMAAEADFAGTAWLDRSPRPGESASEEEAENGRATVSVRALGPDLTIDAQASDFTLVATSLPDWPGWRAESAGREIALTTVNHAFVGFWLPPGRHAVRLRYLPQSFCIGAALGGTTLVAGALLAVLLRRRALGRL